METFFSKLNFLDPSNINVLEVAETPPGEACPFNWKHHKNSCYLLRNQVIQGDLETDIFMCLQMYLNMIW